MEQETEHKPPNQARNFRNEAAYTLTDVAFLLDIRNYGRISEWENGLSNPSIEHLIGLSLIYQRLESEIYYDLRKRISKKITVRKKLLRELKERERESDDGG
jgi:transcriptional regulator with XRE-family HTH domain